MVHIGRNSFIEIISRKYKLGCFQLTASCFGGVRSFCSITLHNINGGCRGLPLLSRRCATEGSTETSSPLLSVRVRGQSPPLYFCWHGRLSALHLSNTPPNTLGNTSKVRFTPPNPLYFHECVKLWHIGQNTFIEILWRCLQSWHTSKY